MLKGYKVFIQYVIFLAQKYFILMFHKLIDFYFYNNNN